MRALVRLSFAVLALLVFAPSTLFAQASITGIVKDSSGAVLPGVTVEAASPALIERTRTAVTDGSGQYRIEDLRPGTYGVTFTLSGFSTVKREGVELTGTFTAKIDVELKVGAVSETITVTGETPIVDIVNAKQQTTVPNDVLNAVPTARLYHSIVTLVPGVSVSGTQDVGGFSGPTTVTFSMRGGPGNEGRLTVDGLSLGASLNGTGVSYTVADVGNAQEIVFTTAGQLGESEVGGPSMNLVPRTGGNRLSGSFFGNGASGGLASSNYTDALKTAGLPAPAELLKIWDINGGVGGPIRKDKLWFFTAARYQGNRKTASIYVNANADDVTKWTYVPTSQQSSDDGTWKNANVRLTWQASRRNKFNFSVDQQSLCTTGCVNPGGSATTAPEAHYNNHATPRIEQVTWSSPWTSKLLLEAGLGGNIIDDYGTRPNISNYASMIPVVEGCFAGCAANGGIAGLAYRSTAVVPFLGAYYADSYVYNWRASAAVVTGSNSAKVGYFGEQIVNHFSRAQMNDQWLGYTFSNGVPFSFTQYVGPAQQNTHVQVHALYVQDQWTRGRFTLSGALRYDHSASFFPAQPIGGPGPADNVANPFVPVAKVIPETDGTHYNDLTPRVAAVYDVFGNGKTAVKVNVGKYLAAADGSSITGGLTNPIGLLQTNSGARTWTDGNRNFVVDCNLGSMSAQDNRTSGGDFCGAGNANFANLNTPTTTYDPAILHGWGVRPYDWNFGVQVQQQLHPRVSVDVGYFRRIFGNFTATQNLAVATSGVGSSSAPNFGTFNVTVPSDGRLPSAGSTIGPLYNVAPTLFGQTNNWVTLADNYGTQFQHWNGVEVNFSARMRQGLFLQGGTSTGRTSQDSCAIRAVLPEYAGFVGGSYPSLLNPYCHVDFPFLTQVKGLASYTVPRVDVQVSTAFQSIPGGSLAANYAVPNAVVAQSLGRNLSGNAQDATVNLLAPGTVRGDRINQIDLRFGKILKFGGYKTQFSVDLYNALNVNPIQTYNQTYILNGGWLAPTAILPARFAKITVQLDF